MEQIRNLDGNTFRRILCGGARGIRSQIDAINELNVFPVPDGDTGTNMSRTIDSGISKITDEENAPLSKVASDFSKGSLFGARGNSGVILSQFFAGMCGAFADRETVTVSELANAYIEGVKRSYSSVSNPVEGTILTVFRESTEYARGHITDDTTLDAFFRLTIEEAERSLLRTKDILPVLTEADVVDSGGAGYLCIAKGMYESLCSDGDVQPLPGELSAPSESAGEVNYDLFTTDSVLEYGYCTECLVRIQKSKIEPASLDEKAFASELEALHCDSVVVFKEGDVLKVHAHTHTPSDILNLCQRYGEFLNIKIENMSLQHSEKESSSQNKPQNKKKPHKQYGVVTVATGDGMHALFESLGADVVIDGGQTGNPSAEQFLDAFAELDVDCIIVLPNNSNILLTANQASELWGRGNVHVIPTKTLPQGYSALSVFNASVTDVDDQIADLISAKEAVVSGEVTVAIRDSFVGGVEVKEGEYIGILDGELVVSLPCTADALCSLIEKIDDIDEREILTLFVGSDVSDDERVEMTELLEEKFPELSLEVFIGGQEIYSYLIAVE